jgi:hypothetical protein
MLHGIAKRAGDALSPFGVIERGRRRRHSIGWMANG